MALKRCTKNRKWDGRGCRVKKVGGLKGRATAHKHQKEEIFDKRSCEAVGGKIWNEAEIWTTISLAFSTN